jgi:hypothetical protein
MAPDPNDLAVAIALWIANPRDLTDDHLTILGTVWPTWRDLALERRAVGRAAPAPGRVNLTECLATLAIVVARQTADTAAMRAAVAELPAMREELRALGEQVLDLRADKAAAEIPHP